MKDGEVVQIGTPEEIMMSPANEFVEKFVADVNLGKVITAESILKRPETLLIDRGPRSTSNYEERGRFNCVCC